jgi:hypothetical protein
MKKLMSHDMKKIVFASILAGLLSGCATPKYQCLQENSKITKDIFGQVAHDPSCSAMLACLAAKGFLQSPQGDLEVPRGAQIQCS